DARRPRPDELPEQIRPLALCNAVRLTHERFRTDAQSLIKAVQAALEEASALRREQEEAARKAQAEEDRRREEDAARQRAQAQRDAEERARQENEQARLAAIGGLVPDQIVKAEELGNWDFIKAGDNAAELRDHLARFPGGITERFARIKLEQLVWAGLGAAPTLDQLTDFLAEFPAGTHATAASDRRAALERELAAKQEASERAQREDEAWTAASNAGDLASLRSVLRDWPASRHELTARSRVKALEGPPSRRRLVRGVGAAAGVAALGGAIIGLLRQPPAEPQAPLMTGPAPPPSAPPPPRDRLIRTFTGHSERVNAVAFSPDGRTALSGAADNTLKLWDVATGTLVRTFKGHSNIVLSVAFSPDGRAALSGSWDRTLKLWEIETGKDQRTFSGHSSSVWSVAFSPDGYSVPSSP